MNKREKIQICLQVLDRNMKIKDVAARHFVSPTTVRRYLDQYTTGELKLDIAEELEDLRIHAHCAKSDDTETLQRRMSKVIDTIEMMEKQIRRVGL